MKKILTYLSDYIRWQHKGLLSISILFMGVAIYCNYHWRISPYLGEQTFFLRYAGWYLLFLATFSFPYFIQQTIGINGAEKPRPFRQLLILAPALFAWKMSAGFALSLAADPASNAYWNAVLYWPLKLGVMVGVLWVIWRIYQPDIPFYGTSRLSFRSRPYWIMLAVMCPLIAAAATQPDFLAIYPKWQRVLPRIDSQTIWKAVLFELSYGTDFVSIELFFRGFLVLAFAQWLGKEAILPMALFYCTIHFGKPLGECISSFFGGILLGVVTYHTRTIWGGLLVHLGIAWLMEVAGTLGHSYSLP